MKGGHSQCINKSWRQKSENSDIIGNTNVKNRAISSIQHQPSTNSNNLNVGLNKHNGNNSSFKEAESIFQNRNHGNKNAGSIKGLPENEKSGKKKTGGVHKKPLLSSTINNQLAQEFSKINTVDIVKTNISKCDFKYGVKKELECVKKEDSGFRFYLGAKDNEYCVINATKIISNQMAIEFDEDLQSYLDFTAYAADKSLYDNASKLYYQLENNRRQSNYNWSKS